MNKRRTKRRNCKKILQVRISEAAQSAGEPGGEDSAAEEPELDFRAANLPPQRPTAEDTGQASAEAFRQVGKEVLGNELDPEAWAQALAECRGTHDDALAMYARIRSERISRTNQCQKEKTEHLESRRQGCFRDFKDVPLLPRKHPGANGIPGFIDSVFWHVLAVVGMAGSLLAARILWPGFAANVSNDVLFGVILAMQSIPILAWWAGNGSRGVVSYPGMAQLTACVALLTSVLLGVELFKSGDRLMAKRLGEPPSPVEQVVGYTQVQPEEEITEEDLPALSSAEKKSNK